MTLHVYDHSCFIINVMSLVSISCLFLEKTNPRSAVEVNFLVTMSDDKLPLLESIELTETQTKEGMFPRMFAKLINFFFLKNIYHIMKISKSKV